MLLTPWRKLPETMQNEAVKPYYDILRRKRVSLFLKRLGDIIIALIVIILLSPIMLCAAVAVKVNDGDRYSTGRKGSAGIYAKYGYLNSVPWCKTPIKSAEPLPWARTIRA